jgi:hypothetical protein
MYDVIPFIIQLDNDFYLNNFYNDSILEMYFLMEKIQVIMHYSINEIKC